MSNYAKSTKVNVYPTGFRGKNSAANKSYDPESMFNTEDNITRPYRVMSRGSYILTDRYTANSDFAFVINGYYFQIKNFTATDYVSGTNLYAHIYVAPKGSTGSTTNTEYVANSLSPVNMEGTVNELDKTISSVDNFIGLYLDGSATAPAGKTYSGTLLLLEYKYGNYIIPSQYQLKYDGKYVAGGQNYAEGEGNRWVNVHEQLDTKLIYSSSDSISKSNTLTLQGADEVYIKAVTGKETSDNLCDAYIYVNKYDEDLQYSDINICAGRIWQNSDYPSNESDHYYTSKISCDLLALNRWERAEEEPSQIINMDSTGITLEDNHEIADIKSGNITISSNKDVSVEGQTQVKVVSSDADTRSSEIISDITKEDALTLKVVGTAASTRNIKIEDSSLDGSITIKNTTSKQDKGNQSGKIFLDHNSRAQITLQDKNITIDGSGTTGQWTVDGEGITYSERPGTIKLVTGPAKWNWNNNIQLNDTNILINAKAEDTSNIIISAKNAVNLSGQKGGIHLTGFSSSEGIRAQVYVASDQISFAQLPTSGESYSNGLNLNLDEQGFYPFTGATSDDAGWSIGLPNKKFSCGYFAGNVNAHTFNASSLVKVGDNTTNSKIEKDKITSTAFYATSDRRLKENIKPFKSDKSILDLEVKEFNFKDSNKKTIGCIAQELQELYPELVAERDDGYLTIEENKLVYLLLEEVKKLKQEVEKLKK